MPQSRFPCGNLTDTPHTGGIVAVATHEVLSQHKGCVGPLLPNMTGKIVDDNGLDVPEGEAGELWLHGPNIVKYAAHGDTSAMND